MLYIMLIMGIVLFAFGFKKEKESKKEFVRVYENVGGNEEIRLVNHTIADEELKNSIELLQQEIIELKKNIYKNSEKQAADEPGAVHGKQYRQAAEKLKGLYDDKSIETLSKEMEIGKGELLLLKNLSEK